ncbi:N-terminal binuclear Zn cluster-containing/DNA binding domain-containing protein [Trichoderma chlorosporum]
MSTSNDSPSPRPRALANPSNVGVLALRWSCATCRQSKRRCDKMYPKCTMCTQKNTPCNYPGRRKRQNLTNRIKAIVSPVETSIIDSRSTALVEKKQGSVHQLSFPSPCSSFIAERFLDPDVFARAQLKVINTEVVVTDEIAQLVGSVLDIQAVSDKFFKSVHLWMPIISKPHFSSNLLNRLTYKRAELFLLVLSMKLSCARVKTWNTPLYETVKLFQFQIETSGVLSVLVLQASILIALYELGHSIYPAAYLSVGSCARYATALGIDKSILSSAIQFQWIEEEECRRIWWAILVLDRYLNLSDPKRPLITPDADLESYLPVDDEAWETGVRNFDHTFTLATANSYHLGLFARFAQAAHLLSQVLHHVSEESNETAQLRRTIFALVNVSNIEASMRRLEYCSQTAVCYAGILALDHSSSGKDLGESDTRLSNEGVVISQATLDMALTVVHGETEAICDIASPFLVHLLYKMTSIHLRMAHKSPTNDGLEKFQLLKNTLKIIGSRWFCAHTYLSLLEKQEILLVMQ